MLTPHSADVNVRYTKDKQYKQAVETVCIDTRCFRTYRANERGMHPVDVDVKFRNIVDVDVNVMFRDVYYIVVVVDVIVCRNAL